MTNVKKEYSKKKNNLRRAKRSGFGLADIQKFEKQLENYSFLGWLNNFLKLRNDTRSNLKNDDDNIDSSDEEDEKGKVPAISDDDTGRMSDAEANASELSVKRKMSPSMTSPKESSSRNKSGSNMVPGRCSGKEKKQNKDTTQQDDSAEVVKTINKRLQEKSTILSEKVKKR